MKESVFISTTSQIDIIFISLFYYCVEIVESLLIWILEVFFNDALEDGVAFFVEFHMKIDAVSGLLDCYFEIILYENFW